MARYPAALWRPIPANHRPGAMASPVMGVVVHHIVGDLDAAETVFMNPATERSAHFGVGYDGTVRQWVDTADVAFHACNANWTGWVGIEHESPASGELNVALTDAQVAATGALVSWLAQMHGFAVQVTDDIHTQGVAYHAMDPGDCEHHWGRTDCPGAAVIAQRGAIVAAAGGPIASTGPSPVPVPSGPSVPEWPGTYLRDFTNDAGTSTWQQQMLARGWDIVVDDQYGPASAAVCRAFQAEKRGEGFQGADGHVIAVDGVVGPVTWAAAWTAPVT